jgi:hypothetical protein
VLAGAKIAVGIIHARRKTAPGPPGLKVRHEASKLTSKAVCVNKLNGR